MNDSVLNSGCNQNVCGLPWLNSYLETLTDDEKSKVIENESHAVFNFGDGKLFNSLKSVIIPSKTGYKNCNNVMDSEFTFDVKWKGNENGQSNDNNINMIMT